MSQAVTRQSTIDDKDKKDSTEGNNDGKKKKMVNIEKEKQQCTEKSEKEPEKSEKVPEKSILKPQEKQNASNQEVEKKEKKEKISDAEKPEKSTKNTEKEDKQKKSDSKSKVNGKDPKPHNGVADVTLSSTNGNDEEMNGKSTTGGDESDIDEEMLVIDDQDELFPELRYDDNSDADAFEPHGVEEGARSRTRRSQVKATRTPETPRPASGKQIDSQPSVAAEECKNGKPKDDASMDRKLRSSDSPKPSEAKKQEKSVEKNNARKEEKRTVEAAVKEGTKKDSSFKEDSKSCEKVLKVVIEADIEIENNQGESRKPDTNYSKSRVKVSPYRRSGRIADQTVSSVAANYTGNNTTMEMDITESFVTSDEASFDDSSFLNTIRSVRGRKSYKPLGELTIRRIAREKIAAANSSDQPARPTGTVVGRKRKTDPDEVEVAQEATESSKRMRLLDRISLPFRRSKTSTPVMPRKAAEIVGVNTDLPMPTPSDAFDPESLKPVTPITPITPITSEVMEPVTPAAVKPVAVNDSSSKKCIIM